jgi:hypothetical protein
MITLMLPGWSPAWIGGEGDEVVAVFPAELRKGTANCFLPRAPLDARLHQADEDVEALLLSSTASSGVVGIGVTRVSPAS